MAIEQVDSVVRIEPRAPNEPRTGEKHPPADDRDRHPATHEGHPATHEAVGPDAEPVEWVELVELSSEAERLRSQRAILQAVFDGVEQAVDGDADALFETAGRGEYLSSIERSSDLSPEATAKRILDGITGYIYRAFGMAHTDATATDFERFAVDALAGFEQAFAEARKIIEGLVALTPGLASGIDRTEELVHEGLEAFFVAERKRLAGVADQ